MADCLFGDPITDETLKAMPEFEGKQITKRDRAHVAMIHKNSGNDVNVKRGVDALKKKWGTGVSTLCTVYNATGDPITLHMDHNWHGHIGPGPYPEEIANGQWGGFLHVKTAGAATGSSAAVVYRGTNETAGEECDWMVAWDNPWNRLSFDNKVYTQIREAGNFDNNWDTIHGIMEQMNKHNYEDTWKGCRSTVGIGDDSSPTLCAVLTLAPEPSHATLKK